MAEEDDQFKSFFTVKNGVDEEDGEGEDNMDVGEVGEGGQSGGHEALRLPTKIDWNNCRMFVTFLRLFYEVTKQFSASLFVTSNCFFGKIYGIETFIDNLITNKDPLLSSMALKMKVKLDKNWGGDGDKINPLLYVAVTLDPRYKLRWVNFLITKTKGKKVGEIMEKSVIECLKRLYEAYANEGGHRVEAPRAMPRDMMNDDCDDPRLSLTSQFDTFLEEELSSVCESEVDKYLVNPCERRPREKEGEGDTFDILDWWKHNSVKYLVLSRIAQDVLAMPVSTVASKSTFSTGGRILDPFRSSLSPLMVERLVCTQNWLLSTVPISFLPMQLPLPLPLPPLIPSMPIRPPPSHATMNPSPSPNHCKGATSTATPL